ncbi:MAG: hypothetical protein IID40_09475 [Planctomycetes bacterium]|nr:hypothetical protein [Planctomycetota bacterium]
MGVLAGVGVGLPIGWLLCYGALLPFFLGLFFFTLFGLLVGAVVFRVVQGARPIPRSRIAGGTAVVVLAVMTVSLTVEGRDFPDQVGDFACQKARRLPEGMTASEFRQASAQQVDDYLSERFAPGGVVGYFRWALTSGELKPPLAMLRVPFRASQFRYWWALRVVLCAVLLSYGVYSQVAPLAKLPKPVDRAGRAGNPLSKM